MKRRVVVALLAIASLSSTAAAQDWATKMFEVTSHDFGSIARGAKAEFEFVFTNIYVEDVHVAGVRSSCGCTSVEIKQPALVKTYEKGAIVARINSNTFLGQKGATLTVIFDKPFYAEVQLHDRVYVRSDVVFNPGSVDLGTVDQGTVVEREVTVNYAGRPDWQILSIQSGNTHLSGELVETQRSGGLVSYKLKVRLDGKAPAGYLHDHLVLVTNDFRSTQIPLAVEGMVQPGIAVSPSSLFMGVVHPGEKVTKQLVVRAKKPFRIVSITCEDPSFQFDTASEQTPKLVHMIPVTFSASAEPGKVLKTIRIETDLGGETPPELSAYAVVSK